MKPSVPVAQQPTASCAQRLESADFEEWHELARRVDEGEGARGRLVAEVRAALVERVCQGWECSRLSAVVEVVEAEHAGELCARAGLSSRALETWRAPARAMLARRTAETVERLFPEGGAWPAQVALLPPRDAGYEGGPRAAVAMEEMLAQLKKHKVEVVALPQDWYGMGMPTGVEALLVARLAASRESDAEVEAQWGLRRSMSQNVEYAPIFTFVKALTRSVEIERRDVLERRETLGLWLRGQGVDGSICPGEHLELVVEVAEPLHVRVLALESDGVVTQLFPAHDAQDDRVEPGTPLQLGAIGTVVGPRRFLAFGVRSRGELGRFQNAKERCQLPDEVATTLQDGRGAPTASAGLAMQGYRFAAPKTCQGLRGGTGAHVVVKGYPPCW